MPIAPTYPGVYIQEIASGVRTIVGVPTSIAAFVDFFRRGPMNRVVEVLGWTDVQRTFGGLDARSDASYALQQFFLNGGADALVVRVASGTPVKATVTSLNAIAGANALVFTALSEGIWGNNLRVAVERAADTPDPRFNLMVSEVDTVNGQVVVVNQETFVNLSMSPTLTSPPAPPNTPDPNYVDLVVGVDPDVPGSNLIRVSHAGGAQRPLATGTLSDTTFTFPANPPGAGQPLRIRTVFTIGGAPTQADVNLGPGAIANIDEAASRLEAAIRNANPGRPEWAQATAKVVNGRLQVSAGPAQPNAIITFAAAPAAAPFVADNNTVTRLALTGGAVTANVAQYLLGYTGAALGAQAAGAAGNAGNDGTPPDGPTLVGNQAAVPPTGMYALDKADLFNILCLPRIAHVAGTNAFSAAQVDGVISAATAYCEQRRAFFILDTPNDIKTIPQIKSWLSAKATLRHRNLGLYFPRVQYGDPLNNFRLGSFGPSGTLAGVFARTDVERGVWKAPAGTEAVLRGVQSFDYKMTDAENGTINPLAINALRAFDVYGNVSWGARTLDGSDQQASDWKYVPVRRLALFIEESLYRGSKWAVFEPNDEPLWAQLRLNIGAFMHNLFRQGAFQGSTPREAYLVKCDKETTTQNDINLGIVNILVGFAPLKPAEFVIITIQQLAGQIQT